MPKPLPLGLQVRQARPNDISSLANLLSLAPDDGSRYRFPHILDHPDEMRALHEGWLCPALNDATTLLRIAVVPASADGPDRDTVTVVGFTSWTRHETDPQNPVKTRPANINLAEALELAPAPAPSAARAKEMEEEASPVPTPAPKPQALIPNAAHSAAIKRVRARLPPSPISTTPCYELGSLAIHPAFQGNGIGSLLARWGLDRAAAEPNPVPVFVTGEATGVLFYEGALGFRRLRATEYWLDKEGRDISREEVEGGNEAWKEVNGGLSGAHMVWLPEGYVLELGGEVYKG
ncbi:hypothetical protein B0H19DRAFT_1105764 [Mycena capillaripes]|nr:hypothetical protein B0H19DRAFT_1105764 [Mycena capillaripes]